MAVRYGCKLTGTGRRPLLYGVIGAFAKALGRMTPEEQRLKVTELVKAGEDA